MRRHTLMAANGSPAPEPPSPREQPFTIINNRDANCNITINIGASVPTTTLEQINYKIFNHTTGDINEYSIINTNNSSVTQTILIPNYSYVEFFGRGVALAVNSTSGTYTAFIAQSSSDDITVRGNIMSLLYGIDGTFKDALINADKTFSSLFKNFAAHIDASNLILPYNVKTRSYQHIFSGCKLLTAAPELPATTLGEYCYFNMFFGCTSLTTAPVLPATTLVTACYSKMFNGCTSLNYIKCLATDISAQGCTSSWVGGVAATGTFVKSKNFSWSTGTAGIPTGWTVVDDTE